MGLRERRLLHLVQTEYLPQTESDVNALVDGAIGWKIDWDSFGADEISAGNLQHQALGRIFSALRSISRDDLGKQALREHVKTIHLLNSQTQPKAITLKDGTLTITGWYGSDEPGSYFADTEIEHALEDML